RSTGHQTVPFTLTGEYHIAALSVSPDGRLLVTQNGLYRLPPVWERPEHPPAADPPPSPQLTRVVPAAASQRTSYSPVMSRAGKLIATYSAESEGLAVFDCKTEVRQVIPRVATAYYLWPRAYCDAQGLLAVARDDALVVWNLTGGREAAQLKHRSLV